VAELMDAEVGSRPGSISPASGGGLNLRTQIQAADLATGGSDPLATAYAAGNAFLTKRFLDGVAEPGSGMLLVWRSPQMALSIRVPGCPA